MNEPSRRQAAAALGVPADADEAAVRAAFFKTLAENNFVPPESRTAALNLLNRGKLPLSVEGQLEAGRYEKADLDAFMERFWQFGPAHRAKLWGVLDRRCNDPAVRETLGRLKPGLDAVVTRHEDWELDKMAQFIRETFLLPPRERAVKRMEWLANQTFGPSLSARAKWLRDNDPGTTALNPHLVQDLLLPQATPLNVPPLSQQKLDKLAAKEQRKAEIAARKATAQPASSEGSGGGWGFSWHWIWALAIIGRLVVALGGRGSSTPPPTYRPAFTPPVNTSRIPGFPQAGNKSPQDAAKEMNDLREKADRFFKQKSSTVP